VVDGTFNFSSFWCLNYVIGDFNGLKESAKEKINKLKARRRAIFIAKRRFFW